MDESVSNTMKAISIKSYLINVKNENCPLPEDMKIGKGLTWSDTTTIRCAGCVWFNGVSLTDTEYQRYDVDGNVEVGMPDKVFCNYKGK